MRSIDMTEAGDQATAQRRRRMIVDLLDVDAQHAHSAYILSSALRDLGEGSACIEETEGHLEWLAGVGLIETASKEMPVTLARITDRGRGVAAGRIAVEGVAPPIKE